MNTIYQRVRAGILLSLLLGCASTSTNHQQMIDPAQRMEFDGISVLAPQAKNWSLGAIPTQKEGLVLFKKQFSESLEKSEMYTFLAGVRRVDMNEKSPKNSHELLAFIESTLASKNDVRFQTISNRSLVDENRSKALNTDCAQYELVEKESANPLFPGKVFILTTYGFQCRHPYSANIVVDAFCTERYQENNRPAGQVHKEECTAFLNDVQFTPLGTRTEGLMDNPYLDVPAWDYPQWQQTVSAARMLNMQGNNIGAEQLCGQALHFADANTIKSLYAYADLLESRQDDRSLLVRGRANKLMEMRIKQANATQSQTTWLGFVPEEMLEEYATLLETQQQRAEAESIRALGEAYRYTQEVHAIRLRIISQGGNAWGMCIGFQDYNLLD